MSVGLTNQEMTTYFDALDWALDLIGSEPVAQAWSRPSALAGYTTGGVAAHLVQGGLYRVLDLLAEPEPSDRRRVTLGEFFGPNRVDHPDDDDALFALLRTGAEEMASAGPAALVSACATPRVALGACLALERADRAISLVRVPDGQVGLSDYLATRVLEVVVHGDDLVASVPGWAPPDPPSPAVEVCLALCVELAGQRVGPMRALRAFTRAERAEVGDLRVL
jgi:hypothetical protein